MDVLETHGIRHIEIRGVGGRNISEHTLDEVRGIRDRLDERGFRISSIGSPVGKIKIGDDFAPHLDLFRKMLDAAGILGARYIRMFSFFMPKGCDPAEHRGEVLRRWREFVRTAEGRGVTLLHENEKDIYGDTPERCLDLLETLACPYVKAAFDPANFVQCGEEAWPRAFRMLRPHVAYMHIKDALASDGSNVPAGEGDGCFPEILGELKREGWEGFLSLEPHLGMFAGLAALEPGTTGFDLPEGGPRTFAVAVKALKGILNRI
jgi:sugar phosphate isomerase/epimerase